MKTLPLIWAGVLGLALTLPVVSTPAQAQAAASHATQREVRAVESFQELSLGISAEVILRQGPEQRVEVVATAADQRMIQTTVKDGRLRIRLPEGRKGTSWWQNDYSFQQPVKIYVTMPVVRQLSVSGSGSLVAETPIQARQLTLGMSGSGRLRLNAVADELTTSISGSGRIQVSGSAAAHSLGISGSGRIEAGDLRTNSATIRISGSGNCRLHVNQTLDAHISGSGSVVYTGAARVTQRIAGSGSVRKA